MTRYWKGLLLFFLLFCQNAAFSASVVQTSAPASVTTKTINEKIKQAEAAKDLDDDSRAKLIDIYQKILGYIEETNANNKAAEAFRQARKNAPKETKKIKHKLESRKKVSYTKAVKVNEKSPASEIEQQLLVEKANQAAVEAKLNDIKQQIESQMDRPSKARKQLTEAKQLQKDLNVELNAPPPAGERAELTEARQWLVRANMDAVRSKILMLDQELLSQPMRLELLKAQRELSVQSVDNISKRVVLLEKLLNEKRKTTAEKITEETEKAKQEAVGKHPLVQKLADENVVLGENVKKEADDLQRVTEKGNQAKKQKKQIEDEFRSMRQKLEIAGLNRALGQVLLKQRNSLPDARYFRKQANKNEELIAKTGLMQIRNIDELRKMKNIDAYVDKLLEKLPPEEAQIIRPDVLELARHRKSLIENAIKTEETYLRALGELEYANQQLLSVVEEYASYLDKRLLWVRSSPPPTLESLQEIPQYIGALISPLNWFSAIETLGQQITKDVRFDLGLLLFVLIIWKKKRLKKLLVDSGSKVGHFEADSIKYTFQSVVITLILAAPWPLLLKLFAWQLQGAVNSTDFAKAVGIALGIVATIYFYLNSFREVCRPDGLADAHFRWPKNRISVLFVDLKYMMLVFLPLVFLSLVVMYMQEFSLGGELGRILLILAFSSLMVFFYRLFIIKKEEIFSLGKLETGNLATKFRNLWVALSFLVPFTLIVLVLFGYVYTAATLAGYMFDTLWFVLGLVVLNQVAMRWLLLTYRRLAYKEYLARRQALLDAAQEEEAVVGAEGITIEEPEVDLDALSEESRKLVSAAIAIVALVGFVTIWSDLLPAFSFLDNFTLWSYSAVVSGEEKIIPVTLADLGVALIILAITFVVMRRFPALLEIILRQRFNMNAGNRYAVTMLSRYTIGTVGLLLTISMLGGSWSKIQWLVAALGVGIGFGLQEIIANFISGLIILFERPIRVGDTVTVGDTSGVVSRIRIRATTIVTWDRKELLVPNKEFVTGRLLNWSLSDQVTRLVIQVGVAYGSDVEQAMKLMKQAAVDNSRVMEEPAPFVTFETFGDNALGLVLRCYVDSMDYRLSTITELNKEINRMFAEAGISISFPQRDIHLDTLKPLDIRIHHEELKPKPAS